jgi:hypothetical protein
MPRPSAPRARAAAAPRPAPARPFLRRPAPQRRAAQRGAKPGARPRSGARARAGAAAAPPASPDPRPRRPPPQGAHYLGGRFVPPATREKYGLALPPYTGVQQCVRLGPPGTAEGGRFDLRGAPAPRAPAGASAPAPKAPADMRIKYEAGALHEEDVDPDPLAQFDRWFKEAAADPVGGWAAPGGGAARRGRAHATAGAAPRHACRRDASLHLPPPQKKDKPQTPTPTQEIQEPNAIAVASSTAGGAVSVRMVLLKQYDVRGFCFFTNYNSRRAAAIDRGSGLKAAVGGPRR